MLQVPLRAEHHRPPGQRHGVLDQPARQAAAPVCGRGDDAADAVAAAVLAEKAQRGSHHAIGFDPQVLGIGFGIAPVHVVIRAGLLDDEDVLAQLDDAVQDGRRQLGEAGDVYPV